jgi:hypothetical protein
MLDPLWFSVIEDKYFIFILRVLEKDIEGYFIIVHSNLGKCLVVFVLWFFDVDCELSGFAHLEQIAGVDY